MKSFFDYLLEKGVLTADAFVKATLEQAKSSPTLAQISYDGKIFSADEIIKIFRVQRNSNLDFIGAARHLGLLHPEKRKLLNTVVQSYQVPLSSILIKRNYIDIKALVSALDEFLSQVNFVDESSSKSFAETLDINFISDLESSLSESQLQSVINTLSLIKVNSENEELLKELLKDLLITIRAIRGYAKAARSQLIDELSHSVETAIVQTIRLESINSEKIVSILVPVIEEALRFCSLIVKEISSTHSEAEFIGKRENASIYNTIKQKLGA